MKYKSAHLGFYLLCESYWMFLFRILDSECKQLVSKISNHFFAAQLKSVSVNVIGVSDSALCRSVCDLSPNTINPTGMSVLFWQYLSLTGSHASPVCTSPYLLLEQDDCQLHQLTHYTLQQSSYCSLHLGLTINWLSCVLYQKQKLLQVNYSVIWQYH